MTKLLPIATVLGLGLALAPTHLAHAGDAEDRGLAIARKVYDANRGYKGEKAKLELVLVNAHGDRTTREMRSEVREEKSDGPKSLLTIQSPPDVRGTRLLTWAHRKGDDDQWLYMPAFKRVKRVGGKTRSGAFMGSEFSYEDLGSQEVEKYTYKFLREETDGRPTWVVERRPVDAASGYSKQVVWIDREYMNPTRIDYYDRKGELLKRAKVTGYAKHGKWWRPSEIQVVNVQTRKQSIMRFSKRKLGVSFDAEDFGRDRLDE